MEWMRLLGAPLLVYALAAAPADPVREQFEAASRALNSGDLTAAERGFQAVLKANPKHVGALGNLGVVYNRWNRTADAIRIYRLALQIAPNDAFLNLNLALAHLKQDDHRAARPQLEKVLAIQPDHAQARELLATTQILGGAADAGVRTLESMRESANNGTLYFLSIGYLKQGRRDEARRTMDELFSKLGPAQASFLEGRAYYESARFEESVPALEKARELDPRIPGVWRELGKAYVSLRRSSDARAALIEALRRAPEDEEAGYFLGALDILEDRIAEGVSRLEKTRAARPDFWGSYYYLGRAKLQLKDPRGAVPLLEKAAKLNPDEQAIYFQLARALKATGRDAESRIATERFTALVKRSHTRENEALVIR